jgi:hypothetical protein
MLAATWHALLGGLYTIIRKRPCGVTANYDYCRILLSCILDEERRDRLSYSGTNYRKLYALNLWLHKHYLGTGTLRLLLCTKN